ncbi:MAG: hypothetical protein WDN48_20265 [Pseudolabrys sp.]
MIEKGVGREQERIAVGFRACDVTHADIAAGAAAIFDDDGLAGRFLNGRGHHARDDVGRSAGRIGDHDLHGPSG